jgi:hypothetical protein
MPALNLGNKLLGSKIRQFFLRDKRQLLVGGNEKHQNGVALENRKAERTPDANSQARRRSGVVLMVREASQNVPRPAQT